MEFKSNITVASNIFVRKNSDVGRDPDFVHQCRGGLALREMDRRLFGTLASVKLNEVQRKELDNSSTCSSKYNYLHEMTYGPIKGEHRIEWKCRCENINCGSYSDCMPSPLVRTQDFDIIGEIANTTNLEYEWLGTIEKIFIEPDIADNIVGAENDDIPEEFTEVSDDLCVGFTKLDSPTSIIEADINSQILVNAGPGTGKTYTVIERLAYIINSGSIDLGQVLVLCYTNAARDVILKRLAEKGLAAESRQLVICTLDSLAWNNLSEKTEDDLFALGYNGCIQKFNTEFDAEEWSNFEYVIIDELQDLVNERARMTLKILNALQCGYLLLGDNCQAIYDYDCNGADSISSVGFYAELESLLPDGANRYELIGNKRQITELSCRSDDLRCALLEFNIKDANAYFQNEISHLPKSKFLADTFANVLSNGTTAILTRTNGEAEWVSALLHKEKINHHLIRSVSPRPSLNRWMADMFWDYREPRISRDDFTLRYTIRVNSNENNAASAYEAIIASLSPDTGANANYFALDELNKALKKGQNLSPLLTNNPCEELTVSTIHKAKGREFDHVYLFCGFTSSDENTEEARVWYVGATRPRTELKCLDKAEKWYLKRPKTARWIWQAHKRYSCTYFCDRIVVGLLNDVENNGFVYGDLGQSLLVQEHIASRVKKGDTVELRLIDNEYAIFHENFRIGCLSNEARQNILSSIQNFYNWSSVPPRLTDVYVSNIVTVVPGRFPSGADAMFKDSKFWLGLELTGFARADWHYGGANQ